MAFGGGTSRVDFNVPTFGPKKQRQTFVLLFDGTGNKFHGTDEDSCILKILRLLDRNNSNQKHYYQPLTTCSARCTLGIGTYVQSSTYSHTSLVTRAYSWVKKTRDQAIGSSFAEHVMGGYKFLMQHYNQGDDIYIFGFSRGAYTARFLAEMLDYVGLLEVGNEELARFAWKAFARWQRRLDTTEEEKQEKKEIFEFLKSFRDTFSRPVRRLRFLGLFDTVNSVPQFETAFLQRSKFPYTAKSSALVVRHAVSIDERRAKFRQDLVQGSRQKSDAFRARKAKKQERGPQRPEKQRQKDSLAVPNGTALNEPGADRRPAHAPPSEPEMARYRRSSRAAGRSRSPAASRKRSPSPGRPQDPIEMDGRQSLDTDISRPIRAFPGRDHDEDDDDDEADEALPQDIMEVWFPGEHSDIGGGWAVSKNEIPQSHVPLCWMVREAQRAGLRFDPVKMEEMNCGWDADDDGEPDSDSDDKIPPHARNATIPAVQVTGDTEPQPATDGEPAASAPAASQPYMGRRHRRRSDPGAKRQRFHDHHHKAVTQSTIHDSLVFGKGLPRFSVLAWKFMEHLPFRRMDLQGDGTWKPINWPLPLGEVRDIPDTAWIHGSAVRRMEHDPKYRPGNLIVGGGGRGMRVAPEKYGIGDWAVVHEHGDPIGECVVRVRRKEDGEKTVGGLREKEFLGQLNGKADSVKETGGEKN